jgi:prepilin-type N-terminal cleavage/methylation domain-containing protein/prepilin-type processing-associated H-X9-DG protein
MKFQSNRRNAFTLIELLVVIAIIAILASILFPVFGRARENARRSSCQSNLKQIALGIKQYTQDYDERFPNIPGSAPADSPGWAYAIQPYMKSEQIFQCPSDSGPTPPGDTLLLRAATTGFSDFYINANLADTNGVAVSEAALNYTANTVLNGEGTSGTANNYAQQNPAAGQARHLEGANYAFADGHVKWYRPERVLRGTPSTLCGESGANTPTGSNATFCIY